MVVVVVGGGLRVLHVEDNQADVVLVQRSLKKWTDPAVTIMHAARLGEALPILMARRADVALLDLSLPDSAGLATVERAVSVARDIPVIVCTGTDDEDLGLASIEAGAADYVCKDDLDEHSLRRGIMFVLERRRRRQLEALSESVTRYESLIAVGASTEATRADEGPLHVRNADVAGVVAGHYRALLDAYAQYSSDEGPKPTASMGSIAATLGELGASPPDLIRLHAEAVEHTGAGQSRVENRAMVVAARHLALEMMGQLCEFYRAGPRRTSTLLQEDLP